MNSLAHEKSPAHMYRQHIWRQNKKSTCEIWTHHDILHSSEWFFRGMDEALVCCDT